MENNFVINKISYVTTLTKTGQFEYIVNGTHFTTSKKYVGVFAIGPAYDCQDENFLWSVDPQGHDRAIATSSGGLPRICHILPLKIYYKISNPEEHFTELNLESFAGPIAAIVFGAI
ncbi:MAG: hypothetical protein Edafosvirus52_6, partial [Edafosvirus sp.]